MFEMSKNNSAYFNLKLRVNLKELTIKFVYLYNSGQEITKKKELKESVFDFEQARGHYIRKKNKEK